VLTITGGSAGFDRQVNRCADILGGMKLLVGAIAALAGLVIALSSGASLISDLRGQVTGLTSQVKELLPGGDAYSLGLAEGEKILNSASYLDQLDIAALPGASELIASIKSGQITRERLADLANLYFPVAALKQGILDISAENRAEFVRGVLEGYYPQ
jgi:hypothetical protein